MTAFRHPEERPKGASRRAPCFETLATLAPQHDRIALAPHASRREGGLCALVRTIRDMDQTKPPMNLRVLAVDTIIAGVIAGILLEAYLYVAVLLPAHMSLGASWAWVASTVLGKAMLANSSAPMLGLAIHLLVSLGWAGGYAYLAQGNAVMRDRFVTSGIVYGICVMVGMQLILLADGNFLWNGWANYGINAFGHAVFFGIPLAYTVRTLALRRA